MILFLLTVNCIHHVSDGYTFSLYHPGMQSPLQGWGESPYELIRWCLLKKIIQAIGYIIGYINKNTDSEPRKVIVPLIIHILTKEIKQFYTIQVLCTASCVLTQLGDSSKHQSQKRASEFGVLIEKC